MAISSKIGIGAAIVIVGLAGLVYSLPIVSNAAANKTGPVFQESDVPKYPEAYMQYVGIEIISAFVLTGGIGVLAVGLSDSIKERRYPEKSDGQQPTTTTG